MVDSFYSPPSDGAKSTIHAATVDWEKDRKKINGKPVPASKDLRYYSRGLFCSPILTHLQGLTGKVGLQEGVRG